MPQKSPSGLLYRQRSASVDDNKDNPDSEVLYELPDEKQDVVEKTKNSKRPDSILNKVDPDWDYNITIGDVEKRRIKNLPGKDPNDTLDLWFPKKGSVRKVFIALKVKRVSDVDNVAETVKYLLLRECVCVVLFVLSFVFITFCFVFILFCFVV